MDTSAILSFKQPDPMQNLSGLLNIANAGQQLQQNQQRTQQGAIDLQERQALQGVLSDPTNYTDAQGNFDPVKAQSAIMKAAPTTGAAKWQQIAQAHQMSTAAQQAVNNLSTDNRNHIGQVLGAIPAGTDRDTVFKTVDALGTLYKGIGPAIDVFKTGYTNAAKQGGQPGADAFVQQSARGVLPQETQQTMATPGGVPYSTGTESGVISTKPNTTVPVGQKFATTQTQVAPSNQEAVETDAQGNKFVVTRTPSGAIVGTRPLQSQQPGSPGPFTIPAGETADTLKQAQQIRVSSNQAASTVPQQQFNSNQIIKLADEADTGKGAQILAGLGGQYAGIGAAFGTSKKADAYNQLGHFMALQTAELARSSGIGGTDMGRQIAEEQAGTRDWTSDAIKSTARVNRALSTGIDLFNRGVEHAVATSGNPFAARDFQNQWVKAASVDGMKLYDAFRNRQADPNGFQATVHDLGGVGSPQYKAALDSIAKMRGLITGGK